MTRHLLSIADLEPRAVRGLLDLARRTKRARRRRPALAGRTLLAFFQMPSLRTAISFDVAMTSLGGSAIDYASERSPWASGKESIEDVARVLSRYVDAVVLRMHDHAEVARFAELAGVPTINGLTSQEHPTQVLADLLTIEEALGRLEGVRVAYLGDSLNNVTHSLLLAAPRVGLDLAIACPGAAAYAPDPAVLAAARAARFRGVRRARLEVTQDPLEAARGADVLYTDSWMSYRVDPTLKSRRMRDLGPYRVDERVAAAAPGALFMHPLPALRGMEVTAGVIDGPRSVVFDQAENRLHMHRAILLDLLAAPGDRRA
jgi:ornithine carbamoyltransferase